MPTPKLSLPHCRFCDRPWLPPAGVNPDVAYCSACSSERRRVAQEAFSQDGKVTVVVGPYVVRVPSEMAAGMVEERRRAQKLFGEAS